MPAPDELNTNLDDDEILEAFQRALGDMTDDQINAKFAEINAEITTIKARLTALENPETEVEENA